MSTDTPVYSSYSNTAVGREHELQKLAGVSWSGGDGMYQAKSSQAVVPEEIFG
jgi:hypothetical protein